MSRDLLLAEHDWKLLGRFHEGQIVDIDVAPLQGLLIEETQCAHAERDRAERQLLLADHVQLKLAYFFGTHQFRRLAEVFGKLLDGVNVTANCVWGVITALEFVQHPLT